MIPRFRAVSNQLSSSPSPVPLERGTGGEATSQLRIVEPPEAPPAGPLESPLLSVPVCGRLIAARTGKRFSTAKTYDWLRGGVIPHVKEGHRYVIHRAEVISWLEFGRPFVLTETKALGPTLQRLADSLDRLCRHFGVPPGP